MLPNTTLGVSILTGQALSQTPTQSPRPAVSNMPVVTQSIFTSIATSSNFVPASKAPPINVVITSSDPLPTNKVSTSQPILSVTIPPHHIKGSSVSKSVPHNYQIPLPTSSITPVITTPSILTKPPPAISTQSLLSNVAPPVFSAVAQNKSLSKNVSLGGLEIEKTLDQSFNSDKNNSDVNKSNISASSVEEHDPCPDFKPIIPLPDEVPINTGEEGEAELFCGRAKLFRYVDINGVKEWRERGVGNLKILSNPNTEKVRLLMRRDQVHKICANHFITKDMNLTPMTNNDRAYIWAAHDFADEVVVVEKLCVKFKTPEEAKKFHEAFEAAINLSKIEKPSKPNANSKTTKLDSVEKIIKTSENTQKLQTPKTTNQTLGGFIFASTPTFQPKEAANTVKITEIQETPKSSPFASFTFGKTPTNNLFKTPVSATEAPVFSPLVISQEKNSSLNTDGEGSHVEDFVPTAEFKPVISLPDLVEVVTGEENSEILFEARAKLFRYDASEETKEWKERGLGVIKILKDESIRIVMRRDQVHKVCCNHTILKNMTFKLNTNNHKAVVWHAKDFSEGILTPETFTVRFKTEELANQFLQTLQTAQTSLDENNKVVNNKHHKPESRSRTTSFGDKFKPVKGSWECKNCYIVNEGKVNHCVACETPKSGVTAKKTEESGPVFSFGNFTSKSENNSTSFVFGQKPAANTWGCAFKPPEGSWECSSCYLRNSADKVKCISCEASKGGDTNSTKSNTSSNLPVTSFNPQPPRGKFTFGVPSTKPEESKIVPAVVGFGDLFKPKAGTWECTSCLIRNNPEVLYCISCENPKDASVPKKESSKGKLDFIAYMNKTLQTDFFLKYVTTFLSF